MSENTNLDSSASGGAPGLLPDLYAGQLAALGRVLVDMSGRLARHALISQDLQRAAKHAADELRALSMEQGPSSMTLEHRDRLIAISQGLTSVLERYAQLEND